MSKRPFRSISGKNHKRLRGISKLSVCKEPVVFKVLYAIKRKLNTFNMSGRKATGKRAREAQNSASTGDEDMGNQAQQRIINPQLEEAHQRNPFRDVDFIDLFQPSAALNFDTIKKEWEALTKDALGRKTASVIVFQLALTGFKSGIEGIDSFQYKGDDDQPKNLPEAIKARLKEDIRSLSKGDRTTAGSGKRLTFKRICDAYAPSIRTELEYRIAAGLIDESKLFMHRRHGVRIKFAFIGSDNAVPELQDKQNWIDDFAEAAVKEARETDPRRSNMTVALLRAKRRWAAERKYTVNEFDQYLIDNLSEEDHDALLAHIERVTNALGGR